MVLNPDGVTALGVAGAGTEEAWASCLKELPAV